MSKADKKCVELLKRLTSDLHGAPYPGDDFNMELYRIWYEHIQESSQECLEYLEANYPTQKDIDKTLEKIVK